LTLGQDGAASAREAPSPAAAAPIAVTAAAWMNSRRRRYSFLSVISDDGISEAFFNSMAFLLP
jgi:hypothetical protein